jgi:chemotaxis protein methyltransferase CheR
VIDAITTNETYFFREDRQLKAFSEEILPELHAQKLALGDRSLHLWSAGCSTGEEPYTLAMLILESGLFTDWRVEIFASDINRRVLQVARKGIYGGSSFPRPRPRPWNTTSREGREVEDLDEIKRYVSFSYLNLLDRTRSACSPRWT